MREREGGLQLRCTNRVLLCSVGTSVWAVSGWAGMWAVSEAGLGAAAAAFGAGLATMAAGSAPIMLELFGAEELAAARGYCMLLVGLGNLAMPSLAGALSSRLGVPAVFHLLLTLGAAATACQLLIAFLVPRHSAASSNPRPVKA